MILYLVINILLSDIISKDIIVSISIFIVGWVFQFIGHYYEKAKPAFVDDINQLFIGPIYMMAELYFMIGLEKQLENDITPIALTKRKEFNLKQV